MAAEYCASPIAAERAGGLSVLSQWGRDNRHSSERVALAIEALEDSDLSVVRAAAWVLAHLSGMQGTEPANVALIGLAGHTDSEVRWAVVFGLGGREYSAALETLMVLMFDANDEVRDWATFGLGTQCKADSASIREALRARLTDPAKAVRHEALWGLAARRDSAGLEELASRFERDEWVSGDELDAEEALGEMNVPTMDLPRRLGELKARDGDGQRH